MSAIHEITEEWQREGLSPTWVKLQQAKAEHDALVAENADLREKLARKAELLRGCYAADHKQKERIAQLETAIGNLQKVKGRYHTEQAYNALVAALKEDKT